MDFQNFALLKYIFCWWWLAKRSNEKNDFRQWCFCFYWIEYWNHPIWFSSVTQCHCQWIFSADMFPTKSTSVHCTADLLLLTRVSGGFHVGSLRSRVGFTGSGSSSVRAPSITLDSWNSELVLLIVKGFGQKFDSFQCDKFKRKILLSAPKKLRCWAVK